LRAEWRTVRPTSNPLRQDFGPLVVRPPALDRAGSLIDDPILWDAIPLIRRPLDHAIKARGARRNRLDREQQPIHDALPCTEHTRGHDEIGLQDQTRLEFHVEWCAEHLAE
jgi:hypothetical protein